MMKVGEKMSEPFLTLGVSTQLNAILKKAGIVEATTIQQLAIPALLEGKNVIAQSQTGTGKTLAYLLPILTKLKTDTSDLQAIILAPTHELAMQIFQVVEAYSEGTKIIGDVFIGSANMMRQIDRLKKKKPHIIVGTTTRILELAEKKKLKLHNVKLIIADEADKLKAATESWKDYLRIVQRVQRDCQFGYFSATITESFSEHLPDSVEKPIYLSAGKAMTNTEQVNHLYLELDEREKLEALRGILNNIKTKKAIVFVNQTDKSFELSEKLKYKGLEVAELSAELTKIERANVLQQFRTGKIPVLITTDVAARGLDIQDVTHVFIFELTADVESYVHRAGRTGRMGAKGTVISFVSKREQGYVKKIENKLSLPLKKVVYKFGKLIEKNAEKHNKNEHKSRNKQRRR